MKMIKPNVLIIADKEDVKKLNINKQSDYWNIFWDIIDYNRLSKNVDDIQSQIKKHKIDFILYSRNDQVAKKISIGPITKKLEIGYSSFSGIDEKYRIEEMKNCFEDFIRSDNHLVFDIPPPIEKYLETSDNKGTFSLIFDTEQIGGVRYSLPRILKLLNKYDMKVTFFVTNLVKKVYSNVIEKIRAQGHEIGLHGRWHEYLSRYNKEKQTELIRYMIEDFDLEICGANFIGRMNNDTVLALMENKIKYFVYPSINYYRFFCYPKLPTKPLLLSVKNKKIWVASISVETYGRPWSLVKNMIDSVLSKNTKTNHHLNILLHPFRDGNSSHIQDFKKLVEYLIIKKQMKPVRIIDYIDSLDPNKFERANDINQIKKIYHTRSFVPKTKQDIKGFIPENLLLIRRLIKKYL